MPEFISAYGKKVSQSISFEGDAGVTKQSYRDECDIKGIIKRHAQSGILTHVNQMEAKYGDLVGIDFQTSMDIVTSAQRAFAELPSEVRKRFGNDPAAFLDFVNDPESAAQLVEMGLASRVELATMHPPSGGSSASTGESTAAESETDPSLPSQPK